MDRFIFPQALNTQLQYLIDSPLKLGGTLAFHGSYGIGKTSFATYLGNFLANEVIHYDCAKTKSLILEDVECRNRTISLASLWDTDLQIDTRAVARRQFAVERSSAVCSAISKQFDTQNSPVNHVFSTELKLQLRLAQKSKAVPQ